ncbi:hypothetical protein ACTQ3U_07380 [Oscillospiraceae bacterium LCP25S3_F9]
MNQQFDLQNITDAVLKAVKSTGQEENASAENIAKQVAEILKNNNTQISTLDSSDSLKDERNDVAEEPKSLGGSFTLEEPPKAVEEVDTREINVPLNGSFGIKHRTINKDRASMVAAAAANKKVNTQDDTNKTAAKGVDKVTDNKADDVKNIADNKNAAQTKFTVKPTEKTTVNKKSNATVAKSAENKPVDTAVNKNKPAEKPKSLGGSFTLEEPPKAVEEVDTREINVPLNGSFGIKHRTINKDRDSMVAATAADKKVNTQDDTNKLGAKGVDVDKVIYNKLDNVKSIADSKNAAQTESTAKPTEKTTVGKDSNDTVAKPAENKPVNTAVDKKKPAEEPKSLGGSFTLEEPPKTVEEVDTREINVPLNGSFSIKHRTINKDRASIVAAAADKKVNAQDDTNKTAAKGPDEVIDNKVNDVKNIADSKKTVQSKSTVKPTEKTTVGKQGNATVAKPAENKPVDTAISKNKPEEETKSLGGSFTLEEPPKAVEEVDTREINVPLNGSFGIKQKSESKNTDNITTATTSANKKVNTKNDTNKTAAKNSDEVINNKANNVKNIADSKKAVQAESTAKPTEKTTVGKDSNDTVAKPAENKPVNTAVDKKKPAEEPKSLGGSFTLEEPPKTVEEVDTREINVPLNGSFGIKHRTINKDRASTFVATAADKKVNAQDDTNKTAAKGVDKVTDNKADDVNNIADSKKAAQSKSTVKPTEKTTVGKQGNATVAKPAENKPVDTAVSKNKPVEEPKSLGGSFTLEEPPKAVEEVDTREINVPLNGSFGIESTVSEEVKPTTGGNKKSNSTTNKTKKSTAKTKMSTAPINNNVKIDVDDSVILEAAKKIISDYITTEEFANKLKEILK